MEKEIMSLGTSVARMMGEGEKEEEEDVEYKEEQELFEVEVVVMSLGSSDLLHKPSFSPLHSNYQLLSPLPSFLWFLFLLGLLALRFWIAEHRHRQWVFLFCRRWSTAKEDWSTEVRAIFDAKSLLAGVGARSPGRWIDWCLHTAPPMQWRHNQCYYHHHWHQ